MGNLLSKGIAASLEQGAEKGVASTFEELCLQLSATDMRSVPKQEQTYLLHLGEDRMVSARDCCGISRETFQ